MKNKSGGWKKWKSLLASFTMFASILAIFTVVPSSVSASTPINTHYDYIGYMGNNTIYMTTGASLYNGYLSNISVPASSNEKDNVVKLDQSNCCLDYNVYNSIGMATGSNINYHGSSIKNAHEYYCSSEGWLYVNIPVAASGVVLSANEPNPTPPSCWDNVSAWAVFQSATLTGMTNNSNLKFELCRTSDSGTNISGENGTPVSNIPILAIAGDALTAAAVFCPFTSLAVAGVSLSTMSLLSSMLPYSPYTSSQNNAKTPTLNGNGCLYQEMFIKGGKWESSGQTADSIPLGNYTNVYSSQEDYCLKIPCTEFLNNGCLNLSSSNLVVSKPDTQYINLDRCGADCGSSVNLKFPIVPAYTISGQVNSNGKGLANQEVLINENTGGPYECYFYVNTNSSGDFKFFAAPGASYDVCLADDSSYYFPLSVSYNNYNSSSFDFNVYPVTFKESGLSSGQSWSIDFNTNTMSTTASSITFGAPNGTYSYSVSAVTSSGFRYNPSPSSGSVTVSGSGVSESISFSPVSISFEESGLHGNTWSVTINGDTKSTSGSGITFPEPIDTTYSYSVGVPAGYSANPSNGSVYLGSSSTSVSISFTPTYYNTVTFDESGLPSGTQWTVDMAGSQKSSTGTSISFSEPNGNFYFSTFASNGYNPSPGSGTITVSGSSVTKGISFSAPSGGGGGGGSGCVNATTEILMANYTYMQAQYVLPGDYVLAYNVTTHAYQKEEVLDTYVSNHSRMYTINGILETSAYQPILTSQGYVQAQNLTTKDRIYDAFTGRYVKVTSITLSNGNYTMYDFQIPPDYDFIAWGYVVYDLTREP